MPERKHAGPAPSEKTLFAIWDRIDEARVRGSEQAALALATKALQAIARADKSGALQQA